MSWQSLEESINSTLRNIVEIPPLFTAVNPMLPKVVSVLMNSFGSCIGRAKARFPNDVEIIERMENEAHKQFEMLYGVRDRTHVNYITILNLGIQKISEIKEYIKTLEKMQIRDIDDSIPKEVRDDFREACICYANDCYNASAVMCRRAIETITILQNSYTGNLQEGIKKLAEKGLERSIIELAHEIRLLGNVPAAHRDKIKLIRGVTQEECEYLLDFLGAMLNSMYVRPDQIKHLQDKRKK